MPKIKKPVAKVAKSNKQKLSPTQRSQVAKDRWAKIKANKAAEEMVVTINTMLEQCAAKYTPVPSLVETIVGAEITSGQEPIICTEMLPPVPVSYTVLPDETQTPSPQLAPVTPKKPKRIPVPKEFITALKTADSLLAKAIEEYEDCQRRITYLSGSIPRLQRTVLALRNESNPDAPVPLPNAFNYNAPTAFQLPPNPQFQPYVDPLEALQNAQPAPPISRASGGAVQFSPEMVGTLEGPEDDDPDRFIQGPNAGGGWIGG